MPEALITLFYRLSGRIEVNLDVSRSNIFPREQARLVVRLLLALLRVLLTSQHRAVILHLVQTRQVLGAIGCGDRNQAGAGTLPVAALGQGAGSAGRGHLQLVGEELVVFIRTVQGARNRTGNLREGIQRQRIGTLSGVVHRNLHGAVRRRTRNLQALQHQRELGDNRGNRLGNLFLTNCAGTHAHRCLHHGLALNASAGSVHTIRHAGCGTARARIRGALLRARTLRLVCHSSLLSFFRRLPCPTS
ncbi:ABC-type multidrug transport system, ATPase component [Rothia mucilaginosa DY-18]|uniref:ABC-type multidrug transport system, ATPase component n=1 Tax=Rothia mucilaginosa (strain DY-18) TaxID=680646 RepID=D2NNU8_ROTMD|nr:ABC-type multidrug transport system, ATPase component [Rothia mucilaginosa DY-18]